jgi:hypothetical protein
VKDAEVKELRRAATSARGVIENVSGAVEFSARLYWDGARELSTRRPAPAAARPVQGGGNMRGMK